ncbi:MAG: phosphotransferase [Eubacteriales bacterium]
MKEYNQLTPIGKKRRLKKLAIDVLKQYDIHIRAVVFLAEETNVFYKVVDTTGKKYALKIFQEESSTIDDNLAEVFLINEISTKTDIKVPSVIASKSNQSITVVETDCFDTPKRAALYSWVNGVALDGHESDQLFYALGQMTAKLHVATKDTIIPSSIHPKKWDKVFYYNGEVPVYKEEKYQKYLSDEYHRLMDFIIPFLDEELPKYYLGAKPQLIQGDLNPWNVRLHGGELHLLDFEEAMFALPVHDIAIMLFYYKNDEKFDYENVKKNIFSGYSSIAPLPEISEYDIDLLILARFVNFLNYVLLIEDDPTEYCTTRIKHIQNFIDKYL